MLAMTGEGKMGGKRGSKLENKSVDVMAVEKVALRVALMDVSMVALWVHQMAEKLAGPLGM